MWFPKCFPAVSWPSIVPCHYMGQSQHHLRLPSDLAQGHIWGTQGKRARTPFGGLLAGWELRLARCGHLGPWLNYWLGNVSGEIYIDHPGATSGTAVGGSCYQARKARQTGSSDDKSSSLWNQLPIALTEHRRRAGVHAEGPIPTWSVSSEREGEFSSQASNEL